VNDTPTCPCTCHNGGRFAACNITGGCADLHYAETLPPIRGATLGNISPCAYPGCRDDDGNARLTREVICEPSRRHYRKILDRLAMHYVVLRMTLPKPVPATRERVMRVVAKEYGHPAEWASDMARAVADQMGEAHDGLADHLRHDPPPHPGSREYGRVAHAHHYLTSWFERLCEYPAAGDTAEALYDLDRVIRRGLGQTDPRRHLPVPCPGCELLTLVQEIDGAGTDSVECQACGHLIRAEHYGLWTRMLVDDMLVADMLKNPPVDKIG